MDDETTTVRLEWRNPNETSATDRWVTYTATLTARQLGEFLNVLDELSAALSTRQRCEALHGWGCTCTRTCGPDPEADPF